MTTAAKPKPAAPAADPTRLVLDQIAAVGDKLTKVEAGLAEVREKAAQFVMPPVRGPLARPSEPYSFAKLAAVSMGFMNPENAKYEMEVSARLKGFYGNGGFRFHRGGDSHSFLAPVASRDVAHYANQRSDEDARWAGEMRLRVKGWQADEVDPDEAAHLYARGAVREKTLNTLADTQGGILRGFPTLGDLIDIQRNLEVFSRAGVQEISLPTNGMLNLPKQVGTTVSYYAGEAQPVATPGEQKYGQLELQAKKQFVRTELTNDMLRFVGPTIEAMTRNDMAEVMKRKFDRACLDGPGGTSPRGLLSYLRPGSPLTQWTTGQDYVIEYAAGAAGADGNTLTPQDLYRMASVLPDEAQESDDMTWVGRFDFYAAIANRKADAVTAGDQAGPFLFSMMREAAAKAQRAINGYRYTGSSQVSNARAKGAATNLTYLLLGVFREFIIARMPIMEFLATNVSDGAFDNDTTKLRGIAYNDCGPRRAANFCLCDQLVIQ